MVSLIFGRAGSPRTERIYEKIAEADGKCLLITPEQFSLTHETGLLEALGDGAALKVEVLSFRRLPDFVFRLVGGKQRTYISDGGTRIVLSNVLSALQGSLKYFKSLSQKTEFLEMLLSSMYEFTSYQITPDDLQQIAVEFEGKEKSLADKYADLALIYETYLTLLSKEMTSAEFALDYACEKLFEENIFEQYHVFISNFKGFTPQEYKLIAFLILAKSAHISLITDGNIADESGIFSFSNRTAKKIMRLIEDMGEEVDIEILPASKELFSAEIAHIEEFLFVPDGKKMAGIPATVQIIKSDQFYDEISSIAEEIRLIVEEKKARFREIAIVTRQGITGPQIGAILEKKGIPYQMDRGDVVLKYPLYSLVFSAFDVISSNFSLESVLCYLKSGLSGIAEGEADRLEKYATQWKIRGSAWKQDFFKNPLGYNKLPTEESEKQLEELNATRTKAMKPLCTFVQRAKKKTTREITLAIYFLLTELEVPRQLEALCEAFRAENDEEMALKYAQLWDILIDGFDQMVLLAEETMTEKRYAELLRLNFFDVSAGVIPATLDQVLLTSVDKISPAKFEYVFVMDFTEGSFPKNLASGTMITDREKVLLKEMGTQLSPVAYERIFEERYYAYMAFASAKKELFITYSAAEMDGKPKRSSHFLLFVKALFPDLKERVNENHFTSMKTRNTNENGKKDLKFSDADMARKLYEKRGKLSPSSIEKYKKCQFSFFCENGLRLQADKVCSFDAKETGTFIHYILEELFCAFPTVEKQGLQVKDLNAIQTADFSMLIDAIIEKYCKRYFKNFEEESPRFLYQFKRLRKIVDSFTSTLLEEFKHSEFFPLDFEMEIGKDTAPYQIGAEGQIAVKGKIDRVDGFVKDDVLYLRIVDYKTGKKKVDFSELHEGLSLQMFLYLFALLNAGEEKYGKKVEAAGVVYAPVRLDIVKSLERGATEEDFEKERKKAMGKNGLIVFDEKIALAMDKSGKFAHLPIQVKEENGKFYLDERSSSLAKAEDFQNLQVFAEKIVLKTGEMLMSGEIGALPQLGADGFSPCEFCDMLPICNNECEAKPLQRMKAEDFWKELAEKKAVEEENGD